MATVEPEGPPAPSGSTSHLEVCDGSSRLADVGVLFVHGIGQQVQGETLYAWGGTLVQWLERWLTPRGGSVRVTQSLAAPPILVANLPAHAVVEIATRAEQSPRTIVLAETWWAADFPPPSLSHVTKWLLMTGGWVIVSHALTLLLLRFPSLFAHTASAPTQARTLGYVTRGAARHLMRNGLLVGTTIVTAIGLSVLQLALILLSVLSVIPLRAVRSGVRAALLAIQSFLGDSFSVSTSPLVRAAVISHIQRDLGWLAVRCREIILVAHSQGAALSHQAVQDMDPRGRPMLVTFGSGLIKLRELHARSIGLPGWREGLRY